MQSSLARYHIDISTSYFPDSWQHMTTHSKDQIRNSWSEGKKVSQDTSLLQESSTQPHILNRYIWWTCCQGHMSQSYNDASPVRIRLLHELCKKNKNARTTLQWDDQQPMDKLYGTRMNPCPSFVGNGTTPVF